MIWLHLDEDDPNRIIAALPIGWEGNVRLHDDRELHATIEDRHGGAYFVADSGRVLDDVAACEVAR